MPRTVKVFQTATAEASFKKALEQLCAEFELRPPVVTYDHIRQSHNQYSEVLRVKLLPKARK